VVVVGVYVRGKNNFPFMEGRWGRRVFTRREIGRRYNQVNETIWLDL